MLENAVATLVHPAGLVILVGVLIIARPAARLLVRRYGCTLPTASGLVIATGAVLTLTLSPDLRPSAPALMADTHFLIWQLTTPSQWWLVVSGIGGSDERLANVALFAPIGFLAHLVCRRPVLTTSVGVLLSASIEVLQDFTGRSGDLNDIANNTVGIVAGTLLGAATNLARHSRKRGPASPEQKHRWRYGSARPAWTQRIRSSRTCDIPDVRPTPEVDHGA